MSSWAGLSYDAPDPYTWYGQPVATPARWSAWGQVDRALDGYLNDNGQIAALHPQAHMQQQPLALKEDVEELWENEAVESARKSATDAAHYAEVAHGAATRLTITGNVGQLVDTVGALADTVRRMEERAILLHERDEARIQVLELQTALAREEALRAKVEQEAAKKIEAEPTKKNRIETDTGQQTDAVVPVDSKEVQVSVSSPRARADTPPAVGPAVASLHDEESSRGRMRREEEEKQHHATATLLMEQNAALAEQQAKQALLLHERQTLMAERQLMAERRQLETERRRAEEEQQHQSAPPATNPPTTVIQQPTADPLTLQELAHARAEIARLATTCSELRDRVVRAESKTGGTSSSDGSSTSRREKDRRRRSSRRNRGEDDSTDSALNEARVLPMRKPPDTPTEESNAALHLRELELLRSELRERDQKDRERELAEAMAARAKAEADSALMAKEARDQRERAEHVAAQLAQQRNPAPREDTPMMTEAAMNELIELRVALETERLRREDAERREQERVESEAELRREQRDREAERQLRATEADARQKEAEERLVKRVEKLLETTRKQQNTSMRFEGALVDEDEPEDENYRTLSSEYNTTTAAQTPKSTDEVPGPPSPAESATSSNYGGRDGDGIEDDSIVSPRMTESVPSLESSALLTPRWTKSFRSQRAVSITFGESPLPPEQVIRRTMGAFGDIVRCGKRQTTAVVLYADATSAARSARDYQGPWRVKRVLEALSPSLTPSNSRRRPSNASQFFDGSAHEPFSVVESSSRGFESRTLDVVWGRKDLAPKDDKEFRMQFRTFGSIARAFRHDERGMIMFSSPDECDLCLEEYRGPWRIARLAASIQRKPHVVGTAAVAPPPVASKQPESAKSNPTTSPAVAAVAARAVRCTFPAGGSTSEDQLRSVMGQFGTVVRARVGDSSAVVMFAKDEEAERAVDEYRGPWSVDRAANLLAASPAPTPTVRRRPPSTVSADTIRAASVKVAWNASAPPPSEHQIRRVLEEFGPISRVAVRKRSAVVLYRDEATAAASVETYSGPWRLRRLFKQENDGKNTVSDDSPRLSGHGPLLVRAEEENAEEPFVLRRRISIPSPTQDVAENADGAASINRDSTEEFDAVSEADEAEGAFSGVSTPSSPVKNDIDDTTHETPDAKKRNSKSSTLSRDRSSSSTPKRESPLQMSARIAGERVGILTPVAMNVAPIEDILKDDVPIEDEGSMIEEKDETEDASIQGEHEPLLEEEEEDAPSASHPVEVFEAAQQVEAQFEAKEDRGESDGNVVEEEESLVDDFEEGPADEEDLMLVKAEEIVEEIESLDGDSFDEENFEQGVADEKVEDEEEDENEEADASRSWEKEEEAPVASSYEYATETPSRDSRKRATTEDLGRPREPLSSRCVKVSWMVKPKSEAWFTSKVATLGVVFVRASFREKSAVLMFASADQALDAIRLINEEGSFTAVLVAIQPTPPLSTEQQQQRPGSAERRALRDSVRKELEEIRKRSSEAAEGDLLAERCVKVGWTQENRPRSDSDFEGRMNALEISFISKVVRANSAVVMFASAELATSAVETIRERRDQGVEAWTASLVAVSPRLQQQ